MSKYQRSKSAGKFPLKVKEWLEGNTQKNTYYSKNTAILRRAFSVDVNRAAYHYFSTLQNTL